MSVDLSQLRSFLKSKRLIIIMIVQRISYLSELQTDFRKVMYKNEI